MNTNTIGYEGPSLRIGDTFTMAGAFALKLNPARRWWQVWKPAYVADPDALQTFTVIA